MKSVTLDRNDFELANRQLIDDYELVKPRKF